MSTLLPAVRELYSRQPEAFYLEPWELQHLLWSLGYTEDLRRRGGDQRGRRGGAVGLATMEGGMTLLLAALAGALVSGVLLSVALAWGEKWIAVAAAIATVAFAAGVVLVGASL